MVTLTTAPKSQSSASLQTPPPLRSSRSRLFLFVFFSALALSADQLSKFFALRFAFSVVTNTGVSFGLFPSVSVGILIVILVGFIVLMRNSGSPVLLGIIAGSAGSNILDRIVLGGVRDWLTVPVFGLQNNLADWMLCVAVLVLVVQSRNGTDKNPAQT